MAWGLVQLLLSGCALVSCPAVHTLRWRTSGGLTWISCTDTFLIWNVRWAIKSQSAQLTVVTSSKCKMAALIFIQSLQILCGKENSVDQHSVLLRTELQQTYLKTSFRWTRLCDKKFKSDHQAGQLLFFWTQFSRELARYMNIHIGLSSYYEYSYAIAILTMSDTH